MRYANGTPRLPAHAWSLVGPASGAESLAKIVEVALVDVDPEGSHLGLDASYWPGVARSHLCLLTIDTVWSYPRRELLVEIKRRYDSSNLFRMNQNIKPAAV